jgi:tRNA dimethylallyltransferase
MDISRELLRERITRRLFKRLEHGMKEEVMTLVQKNYSDTLLKKCGLEYVALAKYLRGTISEEVMRQEIITTSMQYAKRQQTWNKKYIPIAHMIPVTV